MFFFSPNDMLNKLRSAQNKFESEYRRVAERECALNDSISINDSDITCFSASGQEALSTQRQLLREALEASCTAICVAGEEFVRGIDVLPMLQVLCRVIVSCDDSQTATLVLAFRTLALIADTVPRANQVMAVPSRGNRVVPLLVEYLEKPHVLLASDDLAEELLRCLSFIALVDGGAQVLFEYRVLAHLVGLECLFAGVAYLGQLCLETAHRMLTLMHSQCANDAEPALLQLVQNMEDTISVAFDVPSPSGAIAGRANRAARTHATSAAIGSPFGQFTHDESPIRDDIVIPHTAVTFLPADKFARLKSYCLCLASAFERLAPLSPVRHRDLIAVSFAASTRLAGYACRLHGDQRRNLLILAFSPIVNLYVAQPVDMVPFLIESALLERIVQIVLEVLAAPMRSITAQASTSSSSPVPVTADGRRSLGDPLDVAAATAAAASAASHLSVDTSPLRTSRDTSPSRLRSQRSPRPGGGSLSTPAVFSGRSVTTYNVDSHLVSPRRPHDGPSHALATPVSLTRLSDRIDTSAVDASVTDLSDEQAVALLNNNSVLSAHGDPHGTEGRGEAEDLNDHAHIAADASGALVSSAATTATAAGGDQPQPAQPPQPATFASLLLGNDTANLPFISEELCVLPLLELLLVLLPRTRRTADSHFDHLNYTQPYFNWQWEDDFHNRNDCAEGLGTRLEREYQKKRNKGLRKETRSIITHTSPRILSVDFLGMHFTSAHGRSSRRLFRLSAVSGFAHNLQSGLNAGCLCGHATTTKKPHKSKKEKREARHSRLSLNADEDTFFSPAANPFAAPTFVHTGMTQRPSGRRRSGLLGASAAGGGGGTTRASVSIVGSETSHHGSLHRVASHRRAEAAAVVDEAPSMADDGRANLEQSQLTQHLFEGGRSALLGEETSPTATFATSTTQSPPVSSTTVASRASAPPLLPGRLGATGTAAPAAPPTGTRTALAMTETALGQAASANPHRRADTRVVLIADSVTADPPAPAPHDSPATREDTRNVRPILALNATAVTTPSNSSTSSSSRSSSSDTSATAPTSTDGEGASASASAAARSAPLDGRALATLEPSTPRMTRSRAHAHSPTGILDSLGSPTPTTSLRPPLSTPPLPPQPPRSRRGGWFCCKASSVADNRAETASTSGYASARAVSLSSGQQTLHSGQSATSHRPHAGGRGGHAGVLPTSTEKEDRRLLQDLAEELLTSPTLRQHFLQPVMMSVLLERFLPRLLAVIRNSVNPIVVRHASILMLRCASLACEWAESEDAAPATFSSANKEKEKLAQSLSSQERRQSTAGRKMSLWSLTSRSSVDRAGGNSKVRTSVSVPRTLAASGQQCSSGIVGVNPLVGNALSSHVRTQYPNTDAVRCALAPSTKALAESLVYLLSTNEKDLQPLLGPYFPFRALSEDPRMLYTVMRMGLSVEFCTYVPTVRGEMRLAAADTVLHLMRLERRVADDLPSTTFQAPGRVAMVSAWHFFTLAEAHAVQQRAVSLANAVQADSGDNSLIVGYGANVRLAGADAVMEQAAIAKRNSSPTRVVSSTTATPSGSCPFHQSLASARQSFIQAFRRVGQVMSEQNQQRVLDAELPDGLLMPAMSGDGVPPHMMDAENTKAVWEDRPAGGSTNNSLEGEVGVTLASPINTRPPAGAVPIRGADHNEITRENVVTSAVPPASATTSSITRNTQPAPGDQSSSRSRTFPFSATLMASPAVDLSEPEQLRHALESRVTMLETEVPVRAVRLAVALYYLVSETDLTMRVLVNKAPQVLNEVAQALLLWAYPRFRDRETLNATGGSLAQPSALAMMHDVAEEEAQVSVTLPPTTHQQLTQLTQELTFAVGERLGLSAGASSRTPTLPSLLPVRFTKRDAKSKVSATVADLTWTPIAIHLERFVNEARSRQTKGNAHPPTNPNATQGGESSREDSASPPTTDEGRCELHIAGHVLRYLPVELDPRVLLVVCTSTVGALQSLLVQHTIAPFQPPAPPTSLPNSPLSPTPPPRATTGAPATATAAVAAHTSRIVAPPSATRSTTSSSSSSDEDEAPLDGARSAGAGRSRRRFSGAALAPPMWIVQCPRDSLTSPNQRHQFQQSTPRGTRTPTSVAKTHRTPAVLHSTARLDAPVFDETRGPYDRTPTKPAATSASSPTSPAPTSSASLTSSHSRTTDRRPSAESTGNGAVTASGNGKSERHVLSTTGDPIAAIDPWRLMLLVDGIPLLCPMTSLVDALCYYASSGASLRYYIDEDAAEEDGDDDDAPSRDGASHRSGSVNRNPNAAAAALDEDVAAQALRRLSFWVTIHRIQYVLLEAPLPMSLRLVHTKCGCRGGAPMFPGAPAFYCAPKHLFTMLHEIKSEPSDGALRLLHALTLACREAPQPDDSDVCAASSPATSGPLSRSLTLAAVTSYGSGGGATAATISADPSQALAAPSAAIFREHRLRSGLVHDLHSQLDTILLPPLMYRYLGECFDESTVGTHLASYALWNYPLVFPFAMRMALLDLFLGARRTMSARIIQGSTRFLRSGVGPRLLGFQWMRATQNAVTANTTRIPVKVRRDRLLEEGACMLRHYAFCPFPLDVHFRGEPGIGIGPALELFELMAKALATPETGMWRTEVDANGDRAVSPLLYPSAYLTQRALLHFETFGLLVGRLLMLRRPTCVRFHPLFLRRLLFRSAMTSLQEASRSMALLDPDLEKMLLSLMQMSPDDLEACALTFVLPSSEPNCPEIPLCANGASVPITSANVRAYVTAVRHYHLEYCVDLALQSFRVGLQYVLNPIHLTIFTIDELSVILSGPTGKIWQTRDAFSCDVAPQHGYTRASPMIKYLVEIVPRWNEAQQRAFLRFVTGSGTLPAGGLSEPIKVVRRDDAVTAEIAGGTPGDDGADDRGADGVSPGTRDADGSGAGLTDSASLPTSSTCFHYLKLPTYASKAILEARLLRAIEEGQTGFMLT